MAMMGAAGMTMMGAAGMTGAAGMVSGDAPVPGCEAADKTVVGAAAHAAAVSVLTAQLPCGVSSCHGGMMPQLGVALFDAKDLRTLLVDKPSCEAPSVMLIDKSGGDVALSKSWIWQKLTAPTNRMAGDTVIPQAAWGNPGTTCMSFMGTVMGFGIRMPLGTANVLDESDLSKIRNWICAGAPGPM
jgi:hypothetical protein